MKIFNTMSGKKEELKTINDGEVKIYACGPTVYNYIHIGNARPICVFDILRRYLEYRGIAGTKSAAKVLYLRWKERIVINLAVAIEKSISFSTSQREHVVIP